MFYVYIIRSIKYPNQLYVGMAYDFDNRLQVHNSGGSAHTAKYKPWKLVMSVGFVDEDKAMRFEKYLKTGSGRAFSKRHFL